MWAKPFKFAISIAIYALTFGWLIGQLRRGRRVAWWAGTVAAVFLGGRDGGHRRAGTAGTPPAISTSAPRSTDTSLYDLMAGSIAAVWVATLVISLLLFANPGRTGHGTSRSGRAR